MADISITATDVKLVAAWKQRTGPTDEALDAGEAVRYNTSNGKFTPANGSSEAESRVVGVAINTVTTAGEVSPTVVLGGILDLGDALDSMSYDDDVWLSDTDGSLATTPGTVPKRLGKVIPAWGATTADKLLLVEPDLTGSDLASNGTMSLDFASAREIFSNDIGVAADGAAQGSGGILATDTTPALERINAATDKGLRVRWASGNTDAIQFAPIALPPDLDDSQPITVHFYGEMGGATDTPTLTVAAFFNVGDSDAGGATGALADAVGEVSVSIAAGDVAAHPGVLNLELTPGSHGTDTVDLYAAWIEYTRK